MHVVGVLNTTLLK